MLELARAALLFLFRMALGAASAAMDGCFYAVEAGGTLALLVASLLGVRIDPPACGKRSSARPPALCSVPCRAHM